MSRKIGRREALLGLGSAGAALSAGCTYDDLQPTFGALFRAGDVATGLAHHALLSRQSLAREYRPADISSHFPAVGTKSPTDAEYRQLAAHGFIDWRLPITGLVKRPMAFSLA